MIISIANSARAISLNGGALQPPWRGAHWLQGAGGIDRLGVELQGSPLAVADAISALEGLLAAAQQSEAVYPPLYLLIQPSPAEPTYRTRVRRAALQPLKPSAAQRQSGSQTLEILLARDPFFEGAETEIALTNPFGSQVIGGLDVYNTCDSYEPLLNKKRVNYVQLPNTLAGGMPAPLKLQYTLQPGSAWGAQRLFIGQFIAGYEEINYQGVIEAEAAAAGTTVPGAADFALYSEGFGKRYTLTSAWAQVSSWTLSAAELQKLSGRFVHVLGAFQGNTVSDDLYLKLEVLSGSALIYASAPVKCSADGYQDLGILPLPPLPTRGANAQALTLRLMGRRSNTALTLTMDALYLLAADAYRVIDASIPPAANESIVDNPIDHELYLQKAAGRLNCLSAAGSAPLAIPGMYSRVYWLAKNGNIVDPRINGRVRAWYRPRKEVL